jgi:hypothetical protein
MLRGLWLLDHNRYQQRDVPLINNFNWINERVVWCPAVVQYTGIHTLHFESAEGGLSRSSGTGSFNSHECESMLLVRSCALLGV